MAISLYTVRIVLSTLGVVDYGINNVVGSVVTMFAFLSSTMASASQRFFAFEIGQENQDKLKKIFSVSISIYALISIVIFLLAETIGLWFLNNHVNLPPARIEAANWIYQFSIFSFMLTMFTIPYNALIMAHEKMSFYAYVSIVEVTLKLLIVYVLVITDYDKLKLYSVLTFLITIVVTIVYISYCVRRFKESKFVFYWDSKLFHEIAGYSGWSLFGAITAVLNNQGLNIILNVFFGPVINAARGIAYQVNSAISSFVNNLYNAVNPQIIKSYAEKDLHRQNQLVMYSTKIGYTLLFILSLPVMIKTEYILNLWLGNKIDAHMIIFTRLVLIFSLINVFEGPISQSVRATGKIKRYQIYVGVLTLSILPISYIMLRFGASPESPFYIMIGIYVIAMFVRLNILNSLINFPVKFYLTDVFFRLIYVSVAASSIPLFINFIFKDDNFLAFASVTVSSSLSILLIFYFTMLKSNERQVILNYIKPFLNKLM